MYFFYVLVLVYVSGLVTVYIFFNSEAVAFPFYVKFQPSPFFMSLSVVYNKAPGLILL